MSARHRSLLLAIVAYSFVPLFSGCAAKTVTGEEILASYDREAVSTTSYPVIAGFNEPNRFQKGIGVRATVKDRILAISVRNRSGQRLMLGPDSFRLVLPGSQYAFDAARDDLAGFPVGAVEDGENALFTVALAGVRDVADCGLVLNYPPSSVLMQVIVEQVP